MLPDLTPKVTSDIGISISISQLQKLTIREIK